MNQRTINKINDIINKDEWTPDETGKVELAAKMYEYGDRDIQAIEIPDQKLVVMGTIYEHDRRYQVYKYVCAWLDLRFYWAQINFYMADKVQEFFLEYSKDVLMYEEAYFYFGDLPQTMQLNQYNILKAVSTSTIGLHNMLKTRGQNAYYVVKTYNACIDAISANFGVDISCCKLEVKDMIMDAQREIEKRYKAIRDIINKEQADIRTEKLKMYDIVFKPFDIDAAEPDRAHIKELTSKKNFMEFYDYNIFRDISKPTEH